MLVSPRQTLGYLPATRKERAGYRAEGFPLLFLAFGLIQAGIAALLNPHAASATSVALILHGQWSTLETVWQGSYVLAGVLLVIGILIPYPLAEVLGEWVSMWALGVNVLALLLVRGLAGSGTSLGAFLIAIVICAVRIRVIHGRAHAAVERRHQDLQFPGPDLRQ